MVAIVVIIAAVGAYLLFFASAATNNCQAEKGVQICDVDQTAGGADSILSTAGEAENLGAQGWGTYYGAAFRAPMSAVNGAVPIHRVFNPGASYHDFVTDAQKGQKEAKYGALTYEGVAFFAWTTQQPNTVPVYRISRGGASTQAMFSTDRAWVDNMLAQGANNPDGWKVNQYGDEIAFYAYPPNYKVADTVNPYDCSILENFVSSRCDAARTNLVTKIDNGAPVGNTCPETLEVYQKAPFVSQFDAACQKKWNDYMQRCDIPENFATDRCKGPREALAAAQQAQAEARKKAQAEAAAAAAKNNPTKYQPDKTTKTPPTSDTTTGSTTPPKPTTGRPADCPEPRVRDDNGKCLNPSTTTPTPTPTGSNGCPVGSVRDDNGKCLISVPKLDCKITFYQDGYSFFDLGGGTQDLKYGKTTKNECDRLLVLKSSQRTLNGLNRKKHDYKEYWNGKYIRTIK